MDLPDVDVADMDFADGDFAVVVAIVVIGSSMVPRGENFIPSFSGHFCGVFAVVSISGRSSPQSL